MPCEMWRKKQHRTSKKWHFKTSSYQCWHISWALSMRYIMSSRHCHITSGFALWHDATRRGHCTQFAYLLSWLEPWRQFLCAATPRTCRWHLLKWVLIQFRQMPVTRMRHQRPASRPAMGHPTAGRRPNVYVAPAALLSTSHETLLISGEKVCNGRCRFARARATEKMT